ncbi:Rne/Rng family ribonuclease [Rickettsiales bacterium LUAb2]
MDNKPTRSENKKMLIDATHNEEIRVAVINNNNLEDYDFEVTAKEEVKGNIYLAKVTRVEASLQAAFVEYGRNRQGFLPFNEISIDYFNLSDELKAELKIKDAELRSFKNNRKFSNSESEENKTSNADNNDVSSAAVSTDSQTISNENSIKDNSEIIATNQEENNFTANTTEPLETISALDENLDTNTPKGNDYFMDLTTSTKAVTNTKNDSTDKDKDVNYLSAKNIETYLKEDANYGSRFGYKIQDVLQKNQLILVQVVKDERGNKGASLTTYLSIPGRFCVLMPNSYNVDGGISKKINNLVERQRLKNILTQLEIPNDTSIIIRTAGIDKSKEEINQDYIYITRLWDSIKKQAEETTTPTLIYEEGSLVKKIIRDSLSSEISEIHIDGKSTYYAIIDFAKLIAPDIVKKIRLYKNKNESLFQNFHIEEQVRSIYSPVVFLKSGGYIVINPTEALTSIDINSGKFKGNRNVEETALKNNLEAATEIAKQLKLRNIGGLVVIDFIDMENIRNRSIIEKKLRDEVRSDKAKIQIGQISNFGLLEMARQHVKSSLFEKSFTVCSKCQGIGYVRPLELNSLQILRNISIDVIKSKFNSKEVKITIPSKEAFYILNNKRESLNRLENSQNISITVECDDNIGYPFYKIDELDESKSEDSTVLLLETEIANNISSHSYNNNHKKSKHNKNNHNHNNKYKNNNNHKKHFNKPNNSHQKTAAKSGWFGKLLKLVK